MDYLILFLCLVIDLSTVYLAYKLKRTWIKSNLDLSFVNMIYYVLQFRFIFFGLVVSFLRIISKGEVLQEYNIQPEELLHVYIIEFISNLIFLLTFTYFIKFIKRKSKINNYKDQNFLVIFCLFSINYLFILLFPGFFSNFYGFLITAFTFYGQISVAFLFVYGIKYKKKILLILALTCIILFFAKTLISGLRGGIVGMVVLIIILSYNTFSTKLFKRLLIITFFSLFIFLKINSSLSSIKYEFVVAYANKKFDFSTIKGNVDFMSYYITEKYGTEEKSKQNFISSFAKEYEFRFGAASMFSVGFLRLVQKNKYAYFEPLLNSFYSFLPKTMIDFKKPVTGSMDGTLKTTGMYISIGEITGRDYSMTDFLVGPHFFWELGYIGIIIYSVLSGLLLFIIVRWLEFYGILGLSYFFLMTKPFWFQLKLWPSEFVTLFVTNLTPIFIITTISIYFVRKFLKHNIK